MSNERKYNLFRLMVKSELNINLTPEYRFAAPRKWRFDFAAPDIMLAIEVEGGIWNYGRHNRASGYIKDMEKYNQAAASGWRVLRFTPQQLLTSKTIETIRKAKNFQQLGVK